MQKFKDFLKKVILILLNAKCFLLAVAEIY